MSIRNLISSGSCIKTGVDGRGKSNPISPATLPCSGFCRDFLVVSAHAVVFAPHSPFGAFLPVSATPACKSRHRADSVAHVANEIRPALWTGLTVAFRGYWGEFSGAWFSPHAGEEEQDMLVRNDKNTVFLIQNNRLRQLYETLTAGDVPLELKQMTLRNFEDYMRVLERQAKMHFVTELLWLTCGEDLDALQISFAKKDVKSDDKLSVGDKDSLVRAVVFALGGISEKEISGVFGMLDEFQKSGTGSNELPFF